MKISRHDRKVAFSTLPAGAVFRRAKAPQEFETPIFMKFDAPCSSKSGSANAVGLEDGHPTSFYNGDSVVQLDAEIHVVVADVRNVVWK